MNALERRIVNLLEKWLDFFYQPIQKIAPKDSFRYLICGGGNTLLELVLYFVVYNFVLRQSDWDLGFFKISGHILALIIVFPIPFYVSFWLSKYVTFTGSPLKGRSQLIRFGIIVFTSLLLNYLFMKLFVEVVHIYPTPSKFISSGIVAVFLYFSHKYFSFSQKSKN